MNPNEEIVAYQANAFQEPTPLKREKGKPEPQAGESSKPPRDGIGAESVTGGADSWSSAQNGKSEFETISHMTGVTLRIFPGEVQVLFPRKKKQKKRKPPKRQKGDITTFSRKSRLRLLRLFNRIHLVCLGTPEFITLTARPECWEERMKWNPPPDGSPAHNYIFRKEFLPMLKTIVPECEFVWKMEPHKSGEAHYHLMVWSRKKARKLDSEFYKRKIRRLWRNCIDDHSRSAELYAVKFETCKTKKKVYQYMSKYIMKEEGQETKKVAGRRWGRSSSMPVSPILEVGIRMSAYERIRDFCIELLKRRKSNTEDYIQQILQGSGWFMWLSPELITKLLRQSNRMAEANQYSRYMKTGSTDPPMDELAEIAAAHGYDF